MTREFFLHGVLAVALAHSAAAQAVSACKNLSRSVAVVAGTHNPGPPQTCPSFSISVGGVSFSTPPTCPSGSATYFGTVYTCGGSAPQIHCNPRGYKVRIQISSGGGCPDVAGLSPGSWQSWSEVPQAIVTALSCIPPETEETFDWSASTTSCPTGAEPEPIDEGQPIVGGGGALFMLRRGALDDLGVAVAESPFLGPFERAQEAEGTGLPGPLAEVEALYAALPGVRCTATVTLEQRGFGASESARRRVQVEGVVLGDGRFDVVQSESATVEGEVYVLTRRLRFDGSMLFVLDSDAESGSAWPADHPSFQQAFARVAAAVAPLEAWVRRPARTVHFPDGSYTLATTGDVASIERLVRWGAVQGPGERHLVQVAAQGARPLEWRCFDALGRTRRLVQFEDHRTVGDGAWRAWKVTDTTSFDADPQGRRVITTLEVHRAGIASQGALPSADFEASQLWQVWQ